MFINISKIFNRQILKCQFAATKKTVLQKKFNPTQIFNHNLQFQCKDIFAKFILVQPYHKILSSSKISLRSYKALSIRCIYMDERYVKGASYTSFDLTLRQLEQLLNCNFEKGQKFIVQNGPEKCQIFLQKPAQKQKQSESQLLENKKQEKKQKKSTKTKNKSSQEQKQQIQINLKTQNSQLNPRMSVKDFSILKKVLHQSFPLLSGLESTYQIQLKSMLWRFQNEQIQQEEEHETNNFIL